MSNIKRKNLLFLLVTVFFLSLVSSCGKKHPKEPPLIRHTSIFQLTDLMAEELIKNTRDAGLNISQSVITTFVNLDDVKTSSSFGRLLSEGLGNGLFRRGIHITEIKTSDAISVNPNTGEIILSRNPDELDKLVGAKYVVTGVYSVGLNTVAISSRIIELPSKKIVSVASSEIIKTEDIIKLLNQRDNHHSIGDIKPTAYDKLPPNQKN